MLYEIIYIVVHVVVILVGYVYKDRCPINLKIPLFLLLRGGITVVTILLFAFMVNILRKFTVSINFSKYICMYLACCWQLFIFSIVSVVQYENLLESMTYCNQKLYSITCFFRCY